LAHSTRHARIAALYGRPMVASGSIASQFATASGMTAAAVAVFGFLAHAAPALAGAGERKIQKATVRGGLVGFAFSVVVIVLSAVIG
jgi:uncharacterized membrane protein